MLFFPVILALLLTVGAIGTVSMIAAFPELVMAYPEQAIETAIARSDEQPCHYRADIGTQDHVR
jgi:hypothetical protein